MNKLGFARKEKVQQFISVTGASEKVAIQTMKTADWHLEAALEAFYGQEHIKAAQEKNRCEVLFNKYKDKHCDMILADGITDLCNDLQSSEGADAVDLKKIMAREEEEMCICNCGSSCISHLEGPKLVSISEAKNLIGGLHCANSTGSKR